jgi:hypothetical protein
MNILDHYLFVISYDDIELLYSYDVYC